jgi:hypothetical protein
MTISTTELGELLTALGNMLKGETKAESLVQSETAPVVAGTFEAPVEQVPVAEPEPVQATPPTAEDTAAKRIAELEAELLKVKGQGAVLGLQPIKLATNNTEVLHG